MIANLKRTFFARKANSRFEVALLKATYHGDFETPKPKHVDAVLTALQGQDKQVSSDLAFDLIVKRLGDPHWNSVLKTLLLLHYSLEPKRSVVRRRLAEIDKSLHIHYDKKGHAGAYIPFLEEYLDYLALVSCHVVRDQSLIGADNPEWQINRINNSALIQELIRLIELFKALFSLQPTCRYPLKHGRCPVTETVVSQLFVDANNLYTILKLLTEKLRTRFPNFNKWNKEAVMKPLKEYAGVLNSLQSFFIMGSELGITNAQPRLVEFEALRLDPELLQARRNAVTPNPPPDYFFDIRTDLNHSYNPIIQRLDVEQSLPMSLSSSKPATLRMPFATGIGNYINAAVDDLMPAPQAKKLPNEDSYLKPELLAPSKTKQWSSNPFDE